MSDIIDLILDDAEVESLLKLFHKEINDWNYILTHDIFRQISQKEVEKFVSDIEQEESALGLWN